MHSSLSLSTVILFTTVLSLTHVFSQEKGLRRTGKGPTAMPSLCSRTSCLAILCCRSLPAWRLHGSKSKKRVKCWFMDFNFNSNLINTGSLYEIDSITSYFDSLMKYSKTLWMRAVQWTILPIPYAVSEKSFCGGNLWGFVIYAKWNLPLYLPSFAQKPTHVDP